MICNQCKLQIDEKDEKCPFCGAPNPQFAKKKTSVIEQMDDHKEIDIEIEPKKPQFFFKGVLNMYKRYFDFSGTTGRGEFWSVSLLIFLLLLPFMYVYMTTEPETMIYTTAQVWIINLTAAFTVFSIIPIIALSIRRLHDANFTGWFFAINIFPGIGTLIVMGLLLMPHKKNKYKK